MKSYTKIFLSTALDMLQSKIENTKKIGSLNPLYLIINKTNDHLTLVPTNESKEIIKKYKELWSKTRDLIGLITKD